MTVNTSVAISAKKEANLFIASIDSSRAQHSLFASCGQPGISHTCSRHFLRN